MEALACRAGSTISSFTASSSRIFTSETSRCASALLGGKCSRHSRGFVLGSRCRAEKDEKRKFTARVMADAQREALKSLSTVVTDDAVPEGHKGLHGFLYGEGGAEVHGSGVKEFLGREGEDDGNSTVSYDEYLSPRESFKFAGVYAVYDTNEDLQYVGYSRNVVSTLKSLRGRVGEEKCSSLRVKMYTEASLITRAKLEEEKQRWLDAAGSTPPGNSEEKDLWEGSGRGSPVALMSEEERSVYEEKKLKMRKAMGENLFDDVAGEDDDSRTRRMKLLQATEGDDWSTVIDGQTKQTYDAEASRNSSAKTESLPKKDVNGATAIPEQPTQIVSPFSTSNDDKAEAGARGLYSADNYELTVENVDTVLEEVRPYLIADGGNVDVVGLKDGIISLRLQGACGTCPSSTSTMKMGIERVLREKFGDAMKEVVQVDKLEVGATMPAIDAHLEMLRPAIRNYGGSVEVTSVDTASGECQVKYQGPAPIGMGIQAAIKDKFPDIKQVALLPVDSTPNSITNVEPHPIASQSIPPAQLPQLTDKHTTGAVDRPSWFFWVGLTFVAYPLLFICAFVPAPVLGPLEGLRSSLYLVGAPERWQSVFYVLVVIHVVEAGYALYLARKVDPANASAWFLQTLYMGFFSLNLLLQKAKSKVG